MPFWLSQERMLRCYASLLAKIFKTSLKDRPLIVTFPANDSLATTIRNQLGGAKLVFKCREKSFFSERQLEIALHQVTTTSIPAGASMVLEEMVLHRDGAFLWIERVASESETAPIKTLRNYYWEQRKMIEQQAQESLASTFPQDTTVTSQLRDLAIQVLKEVFIIAAANGDPPISCALVVGGSTVYGPHLSSDIDYLILNEGDSDKADKLADRLFEIANHLGIKLQNAMIAFGFQTKTLNLSDLATVPQQYYRHHMFMNAFPDMRWVPTCGDSALFEKCCRILGPHRYHPRLLRSSGWVLHEIKIRKYLKNRPEGEIENLSRYTLQQFKYYYFLARIVYQLTPSTMAVFWEDLHEKGVMTAEESHAMRRAHAFFICLHHALTLDGKEALTKSNAPLFAKRLGYSNLETLQENFLTHRAIFEKHYQQLRRKAGHFSFPFTFYEKWVWVSHALQQRIQNVIDFLRNGKATLTISHL